MPSSLEEFIRTRKLNSMIPQARWSKVTATRNAVAKKNLPVPAVSATIRNRPFLNLGRFQHHVPCQEPRGAARFREESLLDNRGRVRQQAKCRAKIKYP